jgi:release factor glutamine methyltransferase
MNIGEWLIQSMVSLKEAGVDSPRRDALVLLEDVLQKDRAWVTAHPEHKLQESDLKRVRMLIQDRLHRVPLAYIRSKAWFYGRFFAVNENTLIPRPESENFIDLLKKLQPSKVIDIGTGSGALIITAKLELPEIDAIATDISSKALSVAQKNAQHYKTDVRFLSGSLLEPFHDMNLTDAVIIANLPYVPSDVVTSPEITQEPAIALFSGKDGLDHYRQFWQQLARREQKPRHILVESLESQHEAMTKLASDTGYRLEKTDLLIQQFSLADS